MDWCLEDEMQALLDEESYLDDVISQLSKLKYRKGYDEFLKDITKLLDELKDKKDRSATFFCALTFIYQDKIIQVEGYKEGKIATNIGKLGGFTFGPIFIPNGYQKPYNELTNFETHRHDAVNKLIKKLEELKII